MADSIETVGALKALLANYPDDLPIVLSADPEGNYFGRLADHSEQMIDPEEGGRPEQIWPTPEGYAQGLANQSYTEDDEAPEGCVRALVLWPV